MRKGVVLLWTECLGGTCFWLADDPSGGELRRPLFAPITDLGIRDHELGVLIRVLTTWFLGVGQSGLFEGVVVVFPDPADVGRDPVIRRPGPQRGNWPSAEHALSTEPTWVAVGEIWYMFPRTKTDLWELFCTYERLVAYPKQGAVRPWVAMGEDEWEMEVAGPVPQTLRAVQSVADALRLSMTKINAPGRQPDSLIRSLLASEKDSPRRVAFRKASGEIVLDDDSCW